MKGMSQDGTVKLTRIFCVTILRCWTFVGLQQAHVTSYHTRKERVLNIRW